MFIEPNQSDIKKAKLLNADCIEIHTGKFCTLINLKKNFLKEYKKIKRTASIAREMDLEVHAGHGLTYQSAKKIAKIKNIKELNIGHFIISESIFFGLRKAILNFRKILS